MSTDMDGRVRPLPNANIFHSFSAPDMGRVRLLLFSFSNFFHDPDTGRVRLLFFPIFKLFILFSSGMVLLSTMTPVCI